MSNASREPDVDNENDYIVLKVDGASTEVLSDPGALTKTMRSASADDVHLETHTLQSTDVAELRMESGVVSVAQSLPMTLIEPFESEDEAPVASTGDATWGVEAVGALASSRDGTGVTVAVLDTGIRRSHEAFTQLDPANLVEKDFTGEGNGDENGHGTHCAGTVCGGTVGGKRIGVAPGVERLLVGKVLGASGGGSTAGIVNAMFWAAEQGANVISMSLGINFPGAVDRQIQAGVLPVVATSRVLEAYRENLQLFDRIAALIGKGGPLARCVVVAASGNESRRPDYVLAKAPPSSAEGIMSVGALGRSGSKLEVASFSNTSPAVAAPGVAVESASHLSDSALRSLNGTSMATPHVAGIAALWFEHLAADNAEFDIGALSASVRARTVNNVFIDGTAPTDRGTGLVQAP